MKQQEKTAESIKKSSRERIFENVRKFSSKKLSAVSIESQKHSFMHVPKRKKISMMALVDESANKKHALERKIHH